jgi:septal ring factor EnvC (AmiA/AmiB activator)
MSNRLFVGTLLAIALQNAQALGEVEQIVTPDDERVSIEAANQQALAQQAALEQLLVDVEKRYGETAASLRVLQRQIEQKHQNIGKIEHDILAHQHTLARERKELAGHVKSAYQMGRQEALKLILNQHDPALSSRMMIYYRYIDKARLEKIGQIEQAVKTLEQLEQQKQTETALLERDLEQKTLQQAALGEVRKQRNALLMEAATFSSEEQFSYLRESEHKLLNLIASLPHELGIVADAAPEAGATADAPEKNGEAQAPSDPNFTVLQGRFSGFKGWLSWPVQGRVVRNFNGLQSEGVQSGVLIEAKEGVDVRAVAGGKVTFAGWMRSYGYLVIIDHGEGYMTLYAFNQTLYKQVNDVVKAGEAIAAVGQSGGRRRSGLYFGIRKNAQPIDPLIWCRSE